MSTDAHSHDPSPSFPLQDVEGDLARASHVSHDPAVEIAHAREHFWENFRWFAFLFFPVILLTVIGFTVNFGTAPIVFHPLGHTINLGSMNLIMTLIIAAIRCGCIAYFLAHLFKDFSFVFRTLAFSVFFLGGMIFLSLWDSEVQPGVIGDPVYDWQHPESMKN
jgi:cellulose synthase/poly-beta-1,6-N-acetylglucosamine synthase-like glycosyltransferase